MCTSVPQAMTAEVNWEASAVPQGDGAAQYSASSLSPLCPGTVAQCWRLGCLSCFGL